MEEDVLQRVQTLAAQLAREEVSAGSCEEALLELQTLWRKEWAGDLVHLLGRSSAFVGVMRAFMSSNNREALAAVSVLQILTRSPDDCKSYMLQEDKHIPCILQRLQDESEAIRAIFQDRSIRGGGDLEVPPETHNALAFSHGMRGGVAVVLWNIAKNATLAVRLMAHNAIPILLEGLSAEISTEAALPRRYCGALAALCWHTPVRAFVWQVISAERLATLVQMVDTKLLGTGYNAVNALAFMALDRQSVSTIAAAGGLEKMVAWCARTDVNVGLSARDAEERPSVNEFQHFSDLLYSPTPEVVAAGLWSVARFTKEEGAIRAHVRNELLGILRHNAFSANATVASLAMMALKNCNDAYFSRIGNLDTFVASLDGIHGKKKAELVKALQRHDIDMQLLVTTPLARVEALLVQCVSFSAGPLMHLLNALSVVHEEMEEMVAAARRGAGSTMDLARRHDDEEAQGQLPEVFISYSWSNKSEAHRVRQAMESAGFQAWMDEQQMHGGVQLFEQIDKGVRGSKVFMCCLSDSYATSVNCQRELSLASDLRKVVLPVWVSKLTEGWPPVGPTGPLLTGKLYVDLSTPDKLSRELPQLLNATGSLLGK